MISRVVILAGIIERNMLLLLLSVPLVGLRHLLGLEDYEQIDDFVLVDQGLRDTCDGVDFRNL